MAGMDIDGTTPLCGAVVSDLHLFTNRTTVHEHMPAIRRAAEECRLFVFNGDIFDFHWSRHAGFEASAQAAEEWILELVDTYADTQFVFLLGNHDSVPAYRKVLDSLAAQRPNLEWHAEWYRHGHKLFLHGDIYHGGTTSAMLNAYRARCNLTLRHSWLGHVCYWAFARSGLPALFLGLVSRKTCARRIRAYLNNELGAELHAVKEVFFGHVHTPFADFHHDGLLFHNTGAAVTGMRLNVIRFPL